MSKFGYAESADIPHFGRWAKLVFCSHYSIEFRRYRILFFSFRNHKHSSIIISSKTFVIRINLAIGFMSRVFTNSPGNRGSIPGRVIRKTQKIVLDASLLNTQHYKVWIKDNVEQTRERSSAPPTYQCSSYWKGSLCVTLDEGRQLYFYEIN